MVATSRKVQGDIFKHLHHPTINLVSGIFSNAPGVPAAIEAGTSLLAQPVKLSGGKWVPVVAGDEANVGGLMYSQVFLGNGLAASTDYDDKVAVLTLGPAIVLEDELPTTDVYGGALNWTTLKTAFASIDKHIKFVTDPPTVQNV